MIFGLRSCRFKLALSWTLTACAVASGTLVCHAQSQSEQMASCYKDADRFVANTSDGTIETSKMAPEKLDSAIQRFRGCIWLAKTATADTWDPGMSAWRYTSVLWAAVALAQDGMLEQAAAMLEKCTAKR